MIRLRACGMDVMGGRASRRLVATVAGLSAALAVHADTLPRSAEDLDVAGLVSYAAAVRLNVTDDPALASAYIAFWQQLAGLADVSEIDEERMAPIAAAGELVASAVAAGGLQRGAPYRLADALNLSVVALAELGAGAGPAESMLAAVDQVIAPRVLVNGRYDFAGSLLRPAELGFSPDVWLRCRESPACVEAHDALFAERMGGLSLGATFAERVARDERLRHLPELAQLTAGIVGLGAQLRESGATLPEAAAMAANDYWQALAANLAPTLGGEPAPQGEESLQALLELGRASAWLSGSQQAAAAFGIVGPPMMDVTRFAAQGFAGSAFLSATAGVGLLLAGVHALAMFDGAGMTPPRELDRLVAELRDNAYRNFLGLRAESQLASNLIDTRLVRLGIALDVVKDDVARIETAQRARVRADYLVQDARRWTGFEEDNDRCFSLRTRNPATGLLQPAEFRRCEERFLQGAVRRSQYATRARDFMLDARFLEAADLRFPFRHHYPLLLAFGGIDPNAALALNDPFEWQQHTAALLRLYQENPAAPADYARRSEVLRSLRGAGMRMHDALAALVLEQGGNGPRAGFNLALHQRALDEYFGALRNLVRRVGALDDPEADEYGKRLTAGFDQPLPAGRKRTAIEALLSGAREGSMALRACAAAPDDAFLASESGLLAEARRFFATPITAEELARSWNRDAVAGFGLEPQSYAALVPLPFLWSALEGMGELEICLARFRPGVAEFTRDESPLRNHLQARVDVDATLEVRFRPGPELAARLNIDPARPQIVVARYQGARSCTFGYRMDAEGCSRGQCLAQVVPLIWSADAGTDINGGTCSGDSLVQQLARDNQLSDRGELIDLGEAFAGPYWEGRAAQLARLEGDARRSSEFETASSYYLRYFALAGVTLGAWPDPAEPLAPLFGEEDPVAPRAVVNALLERKVPGPVLEEELAVHQARILEKVAARGAEVAEGDALYQLAHMAGLRETLMRVDLLLAAYRGAL